MRRTKALCTGALSLTLFVACAAHADGMNIKPGLWEIQSSANMNGQQMPDMAQHMAETQKHMAEMKQQMANMPPEMQERMKAMMPQSGNAMAFTNKGITICLSQDQINRSDIAHDPNNHCKTTDINHSGDKTTIKMHCDAPHEADMSTEVTRISDSEWRSTSHMTRGQRSIDTTGSGKWLKADCGDIKPLTQK